MDFQKGDSIRGEFCSLETFEWIWVDSYAGEISAEKSDYQHQKHG